MNDNQKVTASVIPAVQFYAKRNCKKCHGRGWVGVRVDDGKAVRCRCLRVVKTK